MNDLAELLARLVAAFDASQMPFMIAGSFASTAHGLPRATQDLGVVIAPTGPASLDSFLNALPQDEYYFDRDAALEALRTRTMFNVIDQRTGWKVDLILRKHRPFSRKEFERRQSVPMMGAQVFVASPEDTVIAKLEWSKQSGRSTKQLRDVAGILQTVGTVLDAAYIAKWVDELELKDEWAAAQSLPRE